ncbi:MAG: aminoacyl-tRNA hydrolase [Bacteroidetes bacterium]|nr:aminoacyl-tRNA hydrolase [Bacteroidota bacterium]
MKYLIAGLGNISEEYANTRHNIGFDIADALVENTGASFVLDRHAMVAVIKHKGRSLHVIKPTTFMNLSGKAVRYWMLQLKIPLENVMVVVDDIALPFGKIRIRTKGSDAGHNGMKSIEESLGTNAYPRLRFGIGNKFHPRQQIDHVLGDWDDKEYKELHEKIKYAADAVRSFCKIGIELTMNEYN